MLRDRRYSDLVPPDLPSLARLAHALRAWPPDPLQDDAPPAAVATIVRPGERSPEVLFIARAVREGDPWSGDVAFPGGKREVTDPSLVATAVRETFEEVGLVLPPSSFVTRLADVVGLSNGYRVAQLVFVLDERASEEAKPEPNAEVAALFWIPVTTLVDPAFVETTTIERLGNRFQVPSLRLGERTLWGMTYRMTEQLARAMGVGPR
ncbi:MAG: CoA pyrophosphatase [Polyangiaceae bacterium]